MTVVISPCNRKGGVGKSSSVFHLGGYFASRGFRVLLIDNEPQHSLTSGFIGPEAADALDPGVSTAALFDPRSNHTAQQLIHPSGFTKIDFVPGSNSLDQFNGPPESVPVSTLLAVRDFVQQVKSRYDLILIDNPPNLQVCTYSSLAASNFTYCITEPQEFDVQGLVPVQKAIDEVMRTTNPTLRLAGYILNLFKAKRSLHHTYEGLLRQTYGDKVFDTRVPDWNDLAEAISARQPISFYRRHSQAARVIELLARELIERVSDLQKRPPEFQFKAPPPGRSRPALRPCPTTAG